jgi:hypothetical protein
MWKNTVEPGGPRMTIQHMRSLCWITKATVIYSEYVILFAFPQLRLLHERASMLYCYVTRTLPLLFILNYVSYSKLWINGYCYSV